jgi:hypothetical protein
LSQDFRVQRGVSDPIELWDGDQLKISDSLLTFEFANLRKTCRADSSLENILGDSSLDN